MSQRARSGVDPEGELLSPITAFSALPRNGSQLHVPVTELDRGVRLGVAFSHAIRLPFLLVMPRRPLAPELFRGPAKDVAAALRKGMARVRRRPSLAFSFLKHAGLSF